MHKKILRSNILEIRNSIEKKLEKEKKINKFLKSLNFSSSDVIAGYFPTNSEVDILPFIESLRMSITCMPFIEKINHHLLFKVWRKGDKVTKGQTLLIVEAMKVMNNISSPKSGIVEEIFVEDAQPIEYDQPLIVIK